MHFVDAIFKKRLRDRELHHDCPKKIGEDIVTRERTQNRQQTDTHTSTGRYTQDVDLTISLFPFPNGVYTFIVLFCVLGGLTMGLTDREMLKKRRCLEDLS